MKPDLLSVCILATLILGCNTRHVFGFLSSQSQTAAAAAPATVDDGVDGASSPQRLHLAPIFGGIQSHQARRQGSPSLDADAQERAVYDPGDELLHALNAEEEREREQEQELGLRLGMAMIPQQQQQPDYADTVYNELGLANQFETLKKLEEDLRAEQELVDKSALLMKMLEDPTLETLPLVYVEEEEEQPEGVIASAPATATDEYAEMENSVQDLVLGQSKPKRSRYYRRYPWKRHNKNRGNYEPELRYACTPSKEDILKLLINLHENRKGNHSKTVNFCNRKRPAKAVFTNIRFLG
ncbi:GRB10-interacting GYF protein 2 isoform X2 [Drosophila miranda]|uniref:GRB10-interacting GYF protein 2 isoform X2 n=1 Tax=Drosophila miranda TaxID=7229 RepID=UPI0007E64C33|nr:GRB10-interacting GYF protein 2 isoform X2 [Drosophila miranda]